MLGEFLTWNARLHKCSKQPLHFKQGHFWSVLSASAMTRIGRSLVILHAFCTMLGSLGFTVYFVAFNSAINHAFSFSFTAGIWQGFSFTLKNCTEPSHPLPCSHRLNISCGEKADCFPLGASFWRMILKSWVWSLSWCQKIINKYAFQIIFFLPRAFMIPSKRQWG